MPPLVLGLVGSVCAGKSTATDELQRLGARVHNADRHVHELLTQEDVIQEITAAFGEEVLAEDGRISRRKLGARVFQDEAALKTLEGILHPRTGAHILALVAAARKEDDLPLLVIDAPLLIESGRIDAVDKLLVIDAPFDTRAQWAQETRGWDRDELARREARLVPIQTKKEMADYVIENNGSRDDLLDQVRRLWREIL